MNYATNLPTKTNTLFHKEMEASRPSVLSNAANDTKHFFRFIIDKVERVSSNHIYTWQLEMLVFSK